MLVEVLTILAKARSTNSKNKMKYIAVLALAGSAAAFAPSQESRSSTALSAKPFSQELGSQAPVSFLRHGTLKFCSK